METDRRWRVTERQRGEEGGLGGHQVRPTVGRQPTRRNSRGVKKWPRDETGDAGRKVTSSETQSGLKGHLRTR
jgi:hypothetical protein